jgi:hypothetical protein
MIKVTEIWLNRAEGPTQDVGQKKVKSFADANRVIKNWATSAPKNGGYDKVDFKVTWEDGEVYEGRYDMTYEDTWKANIGDQIRRFMLFHSGLERPYWLTEDRYQQQVAMIEKRTGTPREAYAEFLKDREITT